jgi:hypothetical protein
LTDPFSDMSPCGTFRTWLIWPTMSDIEGEADLPVAEADV